MYIHTLTILCNSMVYGVCSVCPGLKAANIPWLSVMRSLQAFGFSKWELGSAFWASPHRASPKSRIPVTELNFKYHKMEI